LCVTRSERFGKRGGELVDLDFVRVEELISAGSLALTNAETWPLPIEARADRRYGEMTRESNQSPQKPENSS
jgi:hypothetical protein